MRERYSCYEFDIICDIKNENKSQWVYIIYGSGCYPYDNGEIESDEWFETQEEARFAAIGRIDLLENGE